MQCSLRKDAYKGGTQLTGILIQISSILCR